MNKAVAGGLLPEPSTVNFGVVSMGQTANATVSLLNGSLAPVEVTQLNLVGQSFSVAGLSNLRITIAVGGSYTLTVQFNPAVSGTATGQLAVVSNSSNTQTAVINLSGTGTIGPGPAALSALSCSNGTMTGSGTDSCTAELTASAPSGGLNVNLSSSNAAVTVPSTVTMPAGAANAVFTASAAPVSTAQIATMMASAGGVFKNFTLQLIAAILALTINATNVAFGDVMVNTPATQPISLTATGNVPVTINGATLTGAGFSMLETDLPATLNPSQKMTLNLEFEPTAMGAATGQLTITSDSPTNGTAVIGLTGTGSATPTVAVAVTPPSVSLNAEATQQFVATVTGTSNTAVTWTVSGEGCNGVACGTISSTGLYTAPLAAPSPATVTITATSVSDLTKSASATATILLPVGTTYYLAPASAGGNDANDGLVASRPWLSPNHSVNCGDVILAAPSGYYSSANFETGNWGKVSCPAGNSVAWLKCAIFDSCKINASSGQPGFYVDQSYWGVQGWEVTASKDTSNWCFGAAPSFHTPVEIHHIIFANDVANGCQQGGFVSFNNGKFASVDYLIIVGNIAYNAAQNGLNCFSGISVYQPIQSDSLPGTHIYVAGNFSWGNYDANPCANGTPTDGDGIIFDTFDGDQGGLSVPYAAQAVADNNLLLFNGGRGLEAGFNSKGIAPFASIYFRHNTVWGNNEDENQNISYCGEVNIYEAFSVQAFLNLAITNAIHGCGTNPIYAYFVGASATNTDSVYQNWGYAASGTNAGIADSESFSFGLNNIFGTNPSLANPITPSAPNCESYSSAPSCMAAVIANFMPTNPAAAGYGYQIPNSNKVYDALFPQWLCNVDLPDGLLTMGCLNASNAQLGTRVIRK